MGFGSSDGNEFFNSWALWQKMTFVLGCAIVLAIGLGFIKLSYDRYKIRKYSKVDKGKKAQTPEMLEAQPVTQPTEDTRDEIPFGIRAIQSGIEVDGVWISRSNTPVGSSRASIMSEKLPRSYTNSQLELPQPVAQGSSRNSSRAPSSFDRAVSAERIPTNDSRSSSPGRGHANDGPRCSNCHHHVSRNSAALYALESPRSAQTSGPPSPPTQAHTGPSSKESSRRTSDESDYMAIGQDVRAYETAYFRPSSQAPIDPRTDLELLRSHRLSHVAETGQLTPRVRKPGNSGEWASVAENNVSTLNGVNYFMPQKTPSPPLPTITDPSDEVGVGSSTGPGHDGHAANQARQAVPLTESYAPNAPYYPDTYEPRGPHHQYSYDQVPYEVNTQQNQERDSQVLRKVNSGFEILRPGTFQPPTPEELELAERRTSHKKLQKKRRASDASRKSVFVEQV
ncbi:hypothetical protein BDW02DRAFT_47719 [Decorospora gaudefroyi]|uniref:Uncharacterized protein n=1 Tax=Decorospora gaudefroyi TaxID=184978 RepID=A0A6A5KDL3_9PLEO|nr:hypothetical protein BDW02DRAFT_47719 [Decorospora gaudefroyi]